MMPRYVPQRPGPETQTKPGLQRCPTREAPGGRSTGGVSHGQRKTSVVHPTVGHSSPLEGVRPDTGDPQTQTGRERPGAGSGECLLHGYNVSFWGGADCLDLF